jgi:hypothetical protein
VESEKRMDRLVEHGDCGVRMLCASCGGICVTECQADIVKEWIWNTSVIRTEGGGREEGQAGR